MEGNIAATYTLVYRFLKQQSQSKAAEAVKKAAKCFVILREDVEQEGPSLEDIIKEWRTRQCTKSGKDVGSSSEESESSDDASSDSEDSSSSDSGSKDTSGSEGEDDDTSDSDDSSHDSDDGVTAKKLPRKGVERDTSVTLSSAGENARELAKQVTKIPEKESTEDKSKSSESDSPESDSSNSDSSKSDSPSETTALRGSDPKTSSSSDSSSTSGSSDEDEANANEKVPTKTIENNNSDSSESSSESEDDSNSESQQSEDARVVKKRKTSESGMAVTTAVATKSQQTEKALQKKEKTPPKVRERFQRVKVQNLVPELLLNNGYEARGGAANDYGERAHRDLIVTRGAGFRKEKNKKKRGSYRGGEITMENHSIRFDS